MSLLKNLFGKKEETINTYEDFWNWFIQNDKKFFNIVKEGKNIENGFFNLLFEKLNQIKEGYFFLSGMLDKNTAELIVTADGNIKNIVYVEELLNAAPKVDGWKFTALKPANDSEDFGIEMNGYQFNAENIKFFSTVNENLPDEINITLVYTNYKTEDKDKIDMGCFIFIDHFLGELNSVSIIDKLKIIGSNETNNELLDINKLKSYLIWREKEFVEKYESIKYNTENDTYSSLEGKSPNGNPLIAIMNTDLLQWEEKASHQWFICVNIKYDGSKNNGLPNNETYELLNEFEDEINDQLKDTDGNLNLGRESCEGLRTIFYACNDFRKPSKILNEMKEKYKYKLEVDFDLYKDKYWSTLNYYINSI